MGTVIRPMELGDVLPLCEAERDVSDENRHYYERHLANQAKGDCSALLALADGRIAGHVFLYYRCRWGSMKNQGLPCVVDLFVFEPYRRAGIATLLMDACEDIARRHSDRIYLDVGLNSDYGPAQQMYIRRGYLPDGCGAYYRQEVCPVDAECRNNDELTLCLIKRLP